jgi:type IV secretory pathway VirD2 relaxase
MLDHKLFSAEQIDFLDKFFKDNPWADNAQIESIVKATGLAESVIKVEQEIVKKERKKNKEVQFGIFIGLYRSTSCEMEFNVYFE